MEECVLGKDEMPVQFWLGAPDFVHVAQLEDHSATNGEAAGSTPAVDTRVPVAQLEERSPPKGKASSSSLDRNATRL